MGTINFIHPAFRPKVVSDKPSIDGYAVSNLISVENYMPPKGFMVESFMRPPVSIYFTFPCNVDIDRIVLHGAVGAQKSTGYDLFCFSAVRKAETCSQRWDPVPGSPAPTVASFNSYTFTPLGRLWQEQQTEYADVVCFSNPSFRGKAPFSVLSPMHSKLFEQLTVDVEMRRQNAHNLMSVSHLLVRITRTAEGRVPALRWIEVWGQPSVTCAKEDLERVLSAYNSVMGKRRTPAPPAHIPTAQIKHNTVPTRPSEHIDSTVDAPAEFCDPITCHVMSQPMLLPCGKSIDLSTLEKFNDDQAKMGRAPSDPFTWVLYTPYVKPVPNTKLKVRIDHYLMTNSAVTAARTLGRSVDLRTVDRGAGKNAAQTSVLLQEQPKQDRAVGVRLPHKPQLYSRPGVDPMRTPQQYSPVSVTPTQKPQLAGYPTTVRSPTERGPPCTFPSDPLASLDRSLELVLAGRPSFHATPAVNSPLTVHMSPNGATSPSYTHTNSALRRIAPKRPVLDQGVNLMAPTTKTPRTHSVGGLSASPASPVIDLTSDSDPEEVTLISTTDQDCLPRTVIRRNPAALHEKSLTQSLDTALDKTLSGLPSFQNSSPQSCSSSAALLSAPVQPKLECVFCTLFREVGVMYKLGCNDVACRDCLSTRRKTGELLCYKCDRTTSTRDIAKLHT